MLLIRACGYGECRILPISMPGTLRSSVYLPTPVVFSAASIMAVGLPMMEKSIMDRCIHLHRSAGILPAVRRASRPPIGPPRRRRYAFCRYHGSNGFIHLVIASAAAEIAAQSRAHIVFGWIGIFR